MHQEKKCMPELALTGVTGKLGGLVAKLLSDAGVATRHLARRPHRAPQLPHTKIVQAAYENNEDVQKALEGVEILLMVSAAEHPERLKQHFDFIDAATTAGVKHIIYTSFYGASSNATFTLARDHAATEAYILEKGVTYTFIRDNFYLDFFVEIGQTYGEIKGPAGNGRVSAVWRSDVSEVIAEILKQPRHWENRILDMTGPEALSLSVMVQQLSKALGKEITYIEETVAEAYESRKIWPAQAWEYDAWVTTYTAIANGELDSCSVDIARVLGRPPKTLLEGLENLA